MIGKQVQNYIIESLIAEGGMGNVYLAVHNQIEKRVAIKVLNPLLASNPELRARFKEEALTMSKFDHPNIVNIIDYVETDENTYLIMEFAEGSTLDKYIADKAGHLDEKECISLFTQMLEALDFIHSNHIIHRDIKPSNFIVSSRKKVKLIDFGIAKRLEGRDKKLTRTGINMGTPFYMSPEQVRGENVDARSDIYSMGVTLYQMAAGHCPYSDATSEYSIYDQIVNQPLPDLFSIHPDASSKLSGAIRKATAKNPADRFQTCIEFIDELHRKTPPEEAPKTEAPVFDRTVISSKPQEPVGMKTIISEARQEPVISKETSDNTDFKQSASEIIAQVAPSSQATKRKKLLLPLMIAGGLISAVIIVLLILLTRDNPEIEKNIAKGDEMMKGAKYDSALVYYNKALEFDKEDSGSIKKVAIAQYMIDGLSKFFGAKYKESYDIFLKASAFGSAEADYYLGELSFNGLGVKKDRKKALEFTQRSIDKGFEMANWRMGWVYETGAGMKRDTGKAVEYYKKALETIKKLAANGDPEAMGNLASYYGMGRSIPKSNTLSLKWRKSASEKGYSFEQVSLGYMYVNDYDSINKDYAEAMRWFLKAADQGEPYGQVGVGNMYYNGHGVIKNCNTALNWYQKAADQDHPEGYNSLGIYYLAGVCTAAQPLLAVEYFKKALNADPENLNALYYMGYCCSSGTGAEKNYLTAMNYYASMIGADSSQALAYYSISELYRTGGPGLGKDFKKSYDYCLTAANMGNANAQNMMGMKYYSGEGCGKDMDMAKFWFKKAADQGHETAKENLAAVSKPQQQKSKSYYYYTPPKRKGGAGQVQ